MGDRAREEIEEERERERGGEGKRGERTEERRKTGREERLYRALLLKRCGERQS